MAIEIRPAGEAAATAAAGQVIGTAQKQQRQAEQAQRQSLMERQIKAREDAEQRAMQWELEKMMFRSQQDFAHEMRLHQADLEKEARAKEWTVEKMEIASRMDFEQEERERLRNVDRIQNQVNALTKARDEGKAGTNSSEFDLRLFNLELQLDAAKAGTRAPLMSRMPEKSILDMFKEETETQDTGLTTALKRKDTGEVVEVPVENVEKALETGRFEQIAQEVTSSSKNNASLLQAAGKHVGLTNTMIRQAAEDLMKWKPLKGKVTSKAPMRAGRGEELGFYF